MEDNIRPYVQKAIAALEQNHPEEAYAVLRALLEVVDRANIDQVKAARESWAQWLQDGTIKS